MAGAIAGLQTQQLTAWVVAEVTLTCMEKADALIWWHTLAAPLPL